MNGERSIAAAPTVLHIEDFVEIRELVRVVLERSGYRVIAAGTGDEGLRLAREHRPDVILLDTLMPGPGGEAIARMLRRDPITAGTPVILSPAAPPAEATRQAREAGCQGVLPKPMDVREITGEVTRVLGGGTLHDDRA